MSKANNEELEILINTLSKAEKRYFKLIIQQTKATSNSLFYQLFEHIEKVGRLDKSIALKNIPKLKKSQISNLKKQLYNHILDALRLFHKNNSIELSLRASIDNGKMLYNKALYQQSLKTLDKAKQKSIRYNLYSIALEIIEFEKYIESQHITNAKKYRAKELVEESRSIKKIVDSINSYLNLSLSLYDLYLTEGFVKNEKKYDYVTHFFIKNKPERDSKNFDSYTFFEDLYLIQSHVWYHYMTQNFSQYYRYAYYWVQLFKDNPEMIELRPTLFLKGIHNLLTGQYNVYYYEDYLNTLNELSNIEALYNISMDYNRIGLKDLYYNIHKIDLFFWTGAFEDGVQFVENLEAKKDKKIYQWDKYREMNFYFKIASMYFGNGEHHKANLYLNKIINHPKLVTQSELYGYAMILQAMTQFELGNMEYIDYLIKSIFRYFKLKESLQLVEITILKFIRKMPSLTQSNYIESFIAFRKQLELLQVQKYEKRAFLFLDIISWLESKIERVDVKVVIKKKFRHKIRKA